MLKTLAILTVIVASCGSLEPIPGKTANGGSQGSQNPKQQTDPGKNPAKPAPVITIIRKNCDSEAFKNDSDCKAAVQKPSPIEISKLPSANVTIDRSPERDRFDWIAYAGNLLLVGVGIGTLIAVWIQAKRMGEHAKELKKVANAALLNAQAIINAERAWIAATIDEEFSTPDREESIEEHNRRARRFAVARAGEESPTFHIYCINKGRTPAKIIGGDSGHCFIDRPDNLPVPFEYSSPIFLPDPTFTVNGDSFKLHPGFKPDFMWRRGKTLEEAECFTDFLMVYGRITYEDVFTLPDGSRSVHETRWCFAYRPGDERPFVACGPSEYNGHT